jgi:hypothetical protein
MIVKTFKVILLAHASNVLTDFTFMCVVMLTGDIKIQYEFSCEFFFSSK